MKSPEKKLCVVFLISILSIPCAESRIGIENGLIHEQTVRPGDNYDGVIAIRNPESRDAAVLISKADFSYRSDGERIFAPPGSFPRSSSGWISLPADRFTIPGENTKNISYKIEVPDDPSLFGTYWCLLLIREIPGETPGKSDRDQKKTGVGVKQVLEYGLQIITHIGDTGESRVRFLHTEMLMENGKNILQMDVQNTGDRFLRPSPRVRLYDANSNLAGEFFDRPWRILPGSSVRYRIEVSGISPDRYRAVITLINRDGLEFQNECPVVIKDSS
jgi:hypothetical protein